MSIVLSDCAHVHSTHVRDDDVRVTYLFLFFRFLSAKVWKAFCNLVATGGKVLFSATGLQKSEYSFLVIAIIMSVSHDDVVEKVDAHDVTGLLNVLGQMVVLFTGVQVA